MKLNLDLLNRTFIEIEVTIDGQAHTLKFYEKNGNQKKEEREFFKKDNLKFVELDELTEKQFFERLKGDESVIEKIKDFYDENADINNFIKECEINLGKLKQKA
eukprot:Anaeramoba_ignava/a487623_6.p1 GENE.a487623_6~~a487623_6.p1  ORF type:complete len:104 (-),score=27.69 a487623_6:301-612(-)